MTETPNPHLAQALQRAFLSSDDDLFAPVFDNLLARLKAAGDHRVPAGNHRNVRIHPNTDD